MLVVLQVPYHQLDSLHCTTLRSCCFHLSLISLLLSRGFPSLFFTEANLVLTVPHISLATWNSFPVCTIPLVSSISWHFPSIHFSLHLFDFFLISFVISLYLFLFSSLRSFLNLPNISSFVAEFQNLSGYPGFLLLCSFVP